MSAIAPVWCQMHLTCCPLLYSCLLQSAHLTILSCSSVIELHTACLELPCPNQALAVVLFNAPNLQSSLGVQVVEDKAGQAAAAGQRVHWQALWSIFLKRVNELPGCLAGCLGFATSQLQVWRLMLRSSPFLHLLPLLLLPHFVFFLLFNPPRLSCPSFAPATTSFA